ncbi:aminoacyl-histidine dipeptidase [Streptobacillus moniliformis]|uniref:Cytosol non-specific dipeptidase n=1 Tax=Streptobacillus moniliformis (strain ATCC 14647 / DSM 12112 / NCTC 10651 / 9901) TaxID=519441 RepID=D1AXH0_STRM9|nr:aminoacyl-histidine dipeptidase [Streptobacillus moniliformis]ACZ00996.1 aminoacyl-histidine dipeptidase [Streptobacillus moniliformis DSM 12112]SQA13865.1 Cytosol non-specific dipeptidase [Streptobacillus moniliformis]
MENMITKGIYPELVFEFFEKISAIPRGSGKEKKISDWLVNFAKERNLEVYQDDYYNIIIKKDATPGYEKYLPLIIQGHIDMVWEKNKNVDFDFETQGIKLKIEDGFLKADGTTLGADNGIAVAMALALLDSKDIDHPALEILLTSDEEVNMSGAENIDVSKLKAKKMLNLDTEEVGAIYVSSAGGATIRLTTEVDNFELESDDNIYSLEILGLKGGHSGAEIHLKLGNSIKMLMEALKHLELKFEYELILFDGGNKDNAIPREAIAYIATKASKEEIIELMDKFIDVKVEEYKEEESNLRYELNELTDKELRKISKRDTRKVVALYNEFPHGVRTMSKNIEGLVQTSLNCGVLKTETIGNKTMFKVNSLLRSSNIKELDELQDFLIDLGKKYETYGEKVPSFYPWEYKEDSSLRELVTKVFKNKYGKEIEIKAIHAGLECGMFTEKIKDLDVVSFGPNIFGAHTPDEKMEIESVALTWNYLLQILKEYNLVD